jgi:DNA polymerase-3 subunit alpha
MAFAQFEDFSGLCELVIFPRTYKKVSEWLEDYDIFVIKGTLDLTSEKKCKIKANDIVPVELFFDQWPTIETCTLTMPHDFDEKVIDEIKKITPKGKTQLRVSFYENGTRLLLKTNMRVGVDENLITTLKETNIGIKLGL